MTRSNTAAEAPSTSRHREMLSGQAIAEAKLTDWRKLAQGLHARHLVDDFGAGARSAAAGGTVVNDSGSPSLTVIADQDGNTGILCVAEIPAAKV